MFVMVQKGSDEYKWEDGSFVTWESCPEVSGGFVTWERGLESLMNEAKAAMLRRGKGIWNPTKACFVNCYCQRNCVSCSCLTFFCEGNSDIHAAHSTLIDFFRCRQTPRNCLGATSGQTSASWHIWASFQGPLLRRPASSRSPVQSRTALSRPLST